MDARHRRADAGRAQVNQKRFGGCGLTLNPGEDLIYRARGRIVDEGRHDGVLQEAAFQDDRLRVAQATLSQPAPLTGRVRAGTARGPALPGTARRLGRLRVGYCPQPVLGPGPDGVIRGAFAEHPHVFSPGRHQSPLASPWSSCLNPSCPRSRSAAPRPPAKVTMPRPAHTGWVLAAIWHATPPPAPDPDRIPPARPASPPPQTTRAQELRNWAGLCAFSPTSLLLSVTPTADATCCQPSQGGAAPPFWAVSVELTVRLPAIRIWAI